MAATFQVNLSENLKVLRLSSTCDTSQVNSKKFTKNWVVLSSNLPGEGSLHIYTSKSAVQHDMAIFIETLTELTNVCHLGYSKKQLILQLNFANLSLFLLFSSNSTMQLWRKTLEAFIYCFPLFLLKSPQKYFKTGHYIVSYHDNTLSVHSTSSNELKWKWDICRLRRFSFEPTVSFIEIEAGRSSETGEGKFFFTGHRSRQLFDLLESLSHKARSLALPKSISASSSYSSGLNDAVKDDNSSSTRSTDFEVCRHLLGASSIPKTNAADYLTVLSPSSVPVSPLANRKHSLQETLLIKQKVEAPWTRIPSQLSTRAHSKSATACLSNGHNTYQRHPLLLSSSLDVEATCPKTWCGARNHSLPIVKEDLARFQKGSSIDSSSYVTTNSFANIPLISVSDTRKPDVHMNLDGWDYSESDDDDYI